MQINVPWNSVPVGASHPEQAKHTAQKVEMWYLQNYLVPKHLTTDLKPSSTCCFRGKVLSSDSPGGTSLISHIVSRSTFDCCSTTVTEHATQHGVYSWSNWQTAVHYTWGTAKYTTQAYQQPQTIVATWNILELKLCASPTSWKELIDWPHNTLAHCESRFNDTHNLSTVLHRIITRSKWASLISSLARGPTHAQVHSSPVTPLCMTNRCVIDHGTHCL